MEKRLLAGSAPVPLVVEDLADSWGMEEWSYRNVLGSFAVVPGSLRIVEHGSIRRIAEAKFEYGKSTIDFRTIAYASLPFIELRLRIQWNEWRKRLKLSIPTAFKTLGCILRGPRRRHLTGSRWSGTYPGTMDDRLRCRLGARPCHHQQRAVWVRCEGWRDSDLGASQSAVLSRAHVPAWTTRAGRPCRTRVCMRCGCC